jgi:hypothetical protein
MSSDSERQEAIATIYRMVRDNQTVPYGYDIHDLAKSIDALLSMMRQVYTVLNDHESFLMDDLGQSDALLSVQQALSELDKEFAEVLFMKQGEKGGKGDKGEKGDQGQPGIVEKSPFVLEQEQRIKDLEDQVEEFTRFMNSFEDDE